jgi:hypothetical protein
VSVFDDLLAFDDLPELADFRFSSGGLLAFPFVRWGLYCAALAQALGEQPAHAPVERPARREQADFLLRAVVENPLRVDRTFDIALFASSAGTVLQRQERWFDRINDYFALEYPEQTLVVDAAYRGRYKRPRVPPHVRAGDALPLAAALLGRLARPNAGDEAMIARLGGFLRQRFPVELPEAAHEDARKVLLSVCAKLPFLHALYHRFFDRVRPKILLVEEGSYGAWGHLLSWARAAGIVTAEFQHGLVGPGHIAYNHGEARRRDDEFARQLPEHLLLYGQYWAEQVRTPSHKVVVGWPHLSRSVSNHRARPRPADPSILIVSQGHVTRRMVELTQALSVRLPGHRFVFRLHPGEAPFLERYAGLARFPNVRISDRGDIFDCFLDACAVVGHSSTALVEALALGLPTFVLDDASSRLIVPPRLGVRFSAVDELAAALFAPPRPDPWSEGLLAADWQRNYRAFVERVIS